MMNIINHEITTPSVPMSQMKDGELATVVETGQIVLKIVHGSYATYLILDDHSNTNSYNDMCELPVIILPKGEVITVKFYN